VITLSLSLSLSLSLFLMSRKSIPMVRKIISWQRERGEEEEEDQE
jgi:hypothetical protein